MSPEAFTIPAVTPCFCNKDLHGLPHSPYLLPQNLFSFLAAEAKVNFLDQNNFVKAYLKTEADIISASVVQYLDR